MMKPRLRWFFIAARYHQCVTTKCTPREDFRAQPFQRLQNERQSALVVIFAVVNFSVYTTDHHRRTHDKVSLHGNQGFARLILPAYSAGISAASRRLRCASHGAFGEQVVSERRTDDRNGFVFETGLESRTRCPVQRVLQNAWNSIVVFWCCNQDPVTFRNEFLHILDCRRTRQAVKILVVERDLFESHYVDRHRSRWPSRESPKNGCAERSFP